MTSSASPDNTPARSSGAWRGKVGLIGRLLLGLVKRIYAVALIAIVLWLSWRAFWYLLDSLIFSAPPPAQIVDLPLRLDDAVLQRPGSAFVGMTVTENPRTPLGHYHRIDACFQPDAFNDCTRAGCHVPLPHGRNKADRAFLNMHATSIHCGVCHLQTEQKPIELAWYDLGTGRKRVAPALLRAYAWLVEARSRESSEWTRADQREIVELIRRADREAGGDPAFKHLADHLAAVRAESEEFAPLLEAARETLPRHFRGEYGAKLALVDPQTRRPWLGHPGSEAAAQEYLSQKDSLRGEEKEAVLTRVHPLRRKPTLHCTDCHRPEGALVDLTTVGYPPARVQALVQPLIMQAIEHIVEGREFHMPTFIRPRDETTPQSDDAAGKP
ncbi:MAG: hypothetical protein ACE5I3_00820 [Phycisphaerae bacterium]